MKWTFFIQQKLKVALLLFCIMALIIVTTLLAKRNIGNLDESFQSIYNDRLIPATDIFYLTENLFQKRLLLEKYLNTKPSKRDKDITDKLKGIDYDTDSLINEFSKTYLVVEESKHLAEFRNMVKQYSSLEKEIVRFCRKGELNTGHELFYDEGFLVFNETINKLQSLTQIQTDIGQKLMSKSKNDMSNVTLLYTLQIILVFIIGAMVQALIFASKSTNLTTKQKFDLN